MKKILIISFILVGIAAVFYIVGANNPPNIENPGNASVDGSSQLTETYTDPEFGYSIKLPAGFKVEPEGEYSKRFMPDVEVLGMGPANFIYISVVTPEMKDNTGEIYNYNPDHFNKLIALENIGDSVNLAENDVPDLGEWFIYTVVAVEDIDKGKVKNFENNKPWEFPAGTTENRFIYGTASNIYLLGYYTGGDSTSKESLIDPRIAYEIIKSFKTSL